MVNEFVKTNKCGTRERSWHDDATHVHKLIRKQLNYHRVACARKTRVLTRCEIFATIQTYEGCGECDHKN